MNRKMFALLLILPVAVFATEKIASASNDKDGGNKEKRRAESAMTGKPEAAGPSNPTALEPGTAESATATAEITPANPTQEAIQLPQHMEAEAAANEAPKPIQVNTTSSRAFHAASVAEVKAMMDSLEYNNESFYEEDHIYVQHTEELGEALSAWLKKAVYEPLRAANPYGIRLDRSFSRCPSGYRAVVVANEEGAPTNQGWLIADQGCHLRPMAKFRYDYKTRTVEALAGNTLGFIPLDEFLHLAKAAQG
jgi:hypothetical protein